MPPRRTRLEDSGHVTHEHDAARRQPAGELEREGGRRKDRGPPGLVRDDVPEGDREETEGERVTKGSMVEVHEPPLAILRETCRGHRPGGGVRVDERVQDASVKPSDLGGDDRRSAPALRWGG